jgi:succinate-semialdehyde dehydrogenase/glutarate-semialdehyde dehydrogenase
MPEMNKEDVQLAIDAAAAAFPKFRKTTARERSKMLRKWYDLMVENAEDIARLITWENGKPMADAKGEAAYAANFFEWFSEEAPRAYGDTISATVAGNRVFTLKEPVGVCGLITPWNFPAVFSSSPVYRTLLTVSLQGNDHQKDWSCSGSWMYCCGKVSW